MLSYQVPEKWYENCYRDIGVVIPAARSFSIRNGAKRAVLLIHGYAGYPGELVRPAIDLAKEKFDVFVPRLPGHGTTGEDFQSVTLSDYMSVLENAYIDLEPRYDDVYLLGHSLGTLLVVELAKKFKSKKIVLSAPAFKIKGLNLIELKALSLVKTELKKEWKPDHRYHLHYENAPCDDIELAQEYWSHIYVKKLIEAGELAKMAQKDFKSLKGTEVLCLLAEHDELVDNDITSFLPDGAEVSLIKGATHFMYYDIDTASEEEAVKESVEFLKG